MKRENFWKFVDKSGDCWLWTAGVDRHGYGQLRLFGVGNSTGKLMRAHRLAWELTHGPIPRGNGYHGVVVAHECDNRRCVNPKHLFLTDQNGNLRDANEKGRLRKQKVTLTKLLQLSAEGLRPSEIAARVGLHRANVHARLKRHGALERAKKQSREDSTLAKLTEADVARIREAKLFGANQTFMARIYGVSRGNIYAITQGRSWRIGG